MPKRKSLTKSVAEAGKKVLATDAAQSVIATAADKMEEFAVDRAGDAAEIKKKVSRVGGRKPSTNKKSAARKSTARKTGAKKATAKKATARRKATLGRPRLGRPRLGRPRLGRPRLGRPRRSAEHGSQEHASEDRGQESHGSKEDAPEVVDDERDLQLNPRLGA